MVDSRALLSTQQVKKSELVAVTTITRRKARQSKKAIYGTITIPIRRTHLECRVGPTQQSRQLW
jgi:hypothetical protein